MRFTSISRTPRENLPFIGQTLLTIFFSLIVLYLLKLSIEPKRYGSFWRLVFYHDLFALWAQLGVLIAGLVIVRFWTDKSVQKILQLIDERIVWVALTCFGIYAVMALLIYHQHPVSMDEYSIWLQGQIFAGGQLRAQVAPEMIDWLIYEPFQKIFLSVDHSRGWIVSSYWPGSALLMTPFAFLNAAWLYNPCVTALSVFLTHRLTKSLTNSRDVASWATLFTIASPVIIINAASYYAMPAHLLFNLIFCWLIWQQKPHLVFAAGVVGGFALVLHNPLPHAMFALPWMIYIARKRAKLLLWLGFGYLVFTVPLGIGWTLFLRDFDAGRVGASSGMFALLDQVFRFPTFELLCARAAACIKTIVWASPAMLILAWKGTKLSYQDEVPKLLVTSLGLTFFAYLFVRYDQGHGWGFRYIHSVWFAFPILAALCITRSNDFVTSLRKIKQQYSLQRYIMVTALLSVCCLIPLHSVLTQNFIAKQLAQLPEQPQNQKSYLFINTKKGFFTTDLVQNPPTTQHQAWKFVGRDPKANRQLAESLGAVLKSRGRWGELWVSKSQGLAKPELGD